jgi:hypothetical protein
MPPILLKGSYREMTTTAEEQLAEQIKLRVRALHGARGPNDASTFDALWPVADPPPEWWRTALGISLAKAGARPRADVLSYAYAREVLQVTATNLYTMASRGTLVQADGQGVTTASLMAKFLQRAD